MYRREKLLFALLIVFGLSAVLGGCVGVKDRFVGVAERDRGLIPVRDSLVLIWTGMIFPRLTHRSITRWR